SDFWTVDEFSANYCGLRHSHSLRRGSLSREGSTMKAAIRRHAEFCFEMHMDFQRIFPFCGVITKAELASASTLPGAGPIYNPTMWEVNGKGHGNSTLMQIAV
ncbi:hypothetical protein M758_N005700, partial [Ceratodon purpureus]